MEVTQIVKQTSGWQHHHIWMEIFIICTAFIVLFTLDHAYFKIHKKETPFWLKLVVLISSQIIIIYFYSFIFNRAVLTSKIR